MKLRILFLLSLASMAPMAGGTEPNGLSDWISIHCQVIRTTGGIVGDTSVDENVWATNTPPAPEIQHAITFFSEGHFRLDQDHLDATQTDWKWNNQSIPNSQADSKNILPEGKVQLIDSWTNIVPGQTAKFEIGSKQQVEYFEKASNDVYRLKKIDEPTGLDISMRVEGRHHEPTLRIPNLTISLRSIEKREPVDGTSLPIGRPILKQSQYKLDLRLKNGENYGILLHPGEGQGVLIIRLWIDLDKRLGSKSVPQKNEKELKK